MSNFKKGDRVRLNDNGFECCSRNTTRKEMETMIDTLTVSEVCYCPTNDDPNGQTLWFEEIVETVPSFGVDYV